MAPDLALSPALHSHLRQHQLGAKPAPTAHRGDPGCWGNGTQRWLCTGRRRARSAGKSCVPSKKSWTSRIRILCHGEPGWELDDGAPYPKHEHQGPTDRRPQEGEPHGREQSTLWETCTEPDPTTLRLHHGQVLRGRNEPFASQPCYELCLHPGCGIGAAHPQSNGRSWVLAQHQHSKLRQGQHQCVPSDLPALLDHGLRNQILIPRGDDSTHLQLPAKALLQGCFSHPAVPSPEHPLLPSGVPLSDWDKLWEAKGFAPSSLMGERGIAEISQIPFFQALAGSKRRWGGPGARSHGVLPSPKHLPGVGQNRRVQGSLQRVPPCTQTPGVPRSPSLPRLAGHSHAPHGCGRGRLLCTEEQRLRVGARPVWLRWGSARIEEQG